MPQTLPPERIQPAVELLSKASADLTTRTVQAMSQRLDWFNQLPAETRSWISVIARAGVDGFITWLAAHHADTARIFGSAPTALLRHVGLSQTVELVRVTIAVLGERLPEILSDPDAEIVEMELLAYAREVAFAVAVVYARAAEVRGTWDARLEALIIDAVVREQADTDTLSRASSLGWHSEHQVCVVAGYACKEFAIDNVRLKAGKQGLDVLVGLVGDLMVLIVGGQQLSQPAKTLNAITNLAPLFGEGPVVIGPVVTSLLEAGKSAHAALFGLKAAPGWPGAPKVVSAHDLLPERALLGDEQAQAELVLIGKSLEAHGGDFISTAEAFLDEQMSVEATARALYVHANTVRYRLKRIQEICGYSLADARQSYVLRLSLTMMRMQS